MPRITFTVDARAVAYLRWLARNVLLEKDENGAARGLLMRRLEELRRQHGRHDEPTEPDALVAAEGLTDSPRKQYLEPFGCQLAPTVLS